MDGKENRIDIDEECKELKALIVELAYSTIYDDEGCVLVDEAANEMELYSVINARINNLCKYIHQLQNKNF